MAASKKSMGPLFSMDRPVIKITIESRDLFARGLYDMARSPKVDHLFFASAQGIFRSQDGQTWTQLPLFGSHNHALAISANGTVFVGPFVSGDHGKTFQKFIRWEGLLAKIRKTKGWTPRSLKIEKIKPLNLNGSRLKILLLLDHRRLSVIKDTQLQTWSL